MAPPIYPKIMDANGALIDLQGIQKVRNYPMSSGVFAALTANGTPFPGGPTRGIYATTAGTATIIDLAGNTIANFPITAGYNPISITAINNAASLGNIFGVY